MSSMPMVRRLHWARWTRPRRSGPAGRGAVAPCASDRFPDVVPQAEQGGARRGPVAARPAAPDALIWIHPLSTPPTEEATMSISNLGRAVGRFVAERLE